MAKSKSILKHGNLLQIIDIYSRVVQAWIANKDNIKTEPSASGVTNITKQEFHEAILSFENFLKADETNLIFNPVAASTYLRNNQFTNQANAIIGQINNIAGNPNHWPGAVDHYFNFMNQISTSFFAGANSALEGSTTKEVRAKAVLVNDRLRNIEQLEGYAEATKKELEGVTVSVNASMDLAEDLQKRINTELESLEQYKQGLNQKGLAAAFADRANRLNRSLSGWLIAFTLSLVMIAMVSLLPLLVHAFKEIKSDIYYSQSVETPNDKIEISTKNDSSMTSHSEKDIIIEIVKKIIASSPLIWFAWFSAKRYSITKNLQEEYEFKSATAHAYYGYSQEASTNQELKNLLLEGAIKNFNENPSQAVEKHKHRVTPAEEILSDLLKKLSPDKIIEILKVAKEQK